jgi:hypothetical protein
MSPLCKKRESKQSEQWKKQTKNHPSASCDRAASIAENRTGGDPDAGSKETNYQRKLDQSKSSPGGL